MQTDEPDAGAPELSDSAVMDKETAEKLRNYSHLVELAVAYHDEAARCARAGCFLGGAVMVGAMLEAVLLVMTMAFETDVRGRSLWPMKENCPPSQWGLGKLN